MNTQVPSRPATESESGSVVAVAIVLGVIVGLWQMWVAQKLWRWFAAPTFHTHTPSVYVLFGLSLLVSLIFPTSPPREQRAAERLTFQVVLTLLVWGAAFILHGAAA